MEAEARLSQEARERIKNFFGKCCEDIIDAQSALEHRMGADGRNRRLLAAPAASKPRHFVQ